ncbi:MAG: hypothetical protein EZS28_011803, partial [Streblomastix strix]
VCVHEGESTRNGHYYTYFQGGNGIWYLADDERISAVSKERVLQ